MGIADGRKKWWLRVAAMTLGGMLAAGGNFPGGRAVCEAKETGTSVTTRQATDTAAGDEQEIIDFVTAYRKAFSAEGIETLADYVNDPEDPSFQIDLLRNRAMLELGVKGWENMDVAACPMSDGKHWFVSVSGDLIVDAFDVGIPGLKIELVGRNEEGELKIVLSDKGELSDALLREMQELSLSDEMVDRNNKVAMAYNDLIAERPDIMEWLLEMNEAIDREVAQTLEETLSTKAASEGGNSDTGKEAYTVKKGDCLWTIAEKQLGDGMLWSGLYERNKEVVGGNPDLLYIGITLQL